MSAYQKARIGLVQFLGSNCDQDCVDAMARCFDIKVIPIWHSETSLPKIDGLIIPGGFSYGDFLRSGALASHTRIVGAIKEFVKQGRAVAGICNGFQILVESQILPGALLKNTSGKFVCQHTDLIVGDGSSGYHHLLETQESFCVPIAHGEGRYFASQDVLSKMQDDGQILFRYRDNPNGSTDSIAGIISANGRVMGMMPHPERATDKLIGGSSDGIAILRAFLESCL